MSTSARRTSVSKVPEDSVPLDTVGPDRSSLATPISDAKLGDDKFGLPAPTRVEYASSLKEPEPQPKLFDTIFRRHKLKPVDLDSVATPISVYDDPSMASFYQPRADYEGNGRWDPDARWTHREERALVRKLDWRIMFWCCVMFATLNLDRSNINQATSDNILGDLGLTTDDFNTGNTVFRVAFLCAEVPSQLISKRLGPSVWIPIQMCLWSIITGAQFWLSGKASFLTCRALLGLIQGGFIPDLILYLSYYYKKTELPIRLSFFWLSSNIVSILASFLAYGILHMRGVSGKPGWAWLFMIEGILTLIIGIATFFNMPESPTKSKTSFRPKGWFTDREETIIISRVLRDDPTKGDMHNRQGLSPKMIWKALGDYDLWPLYILGLCFGIPATTPNAYLNLSLRNLGFSTFETNLLAIPSTFLNGVTLCIITFASEFVNERSFICMAEDLWVLPFLIGIYTLPHKPNPWKYYGLVSGLLSFPYVHAIQVAWCSRNAGGVASRSINASVYNMMVQASAVIASQIYRKDDAPDYKRGNRALIGICLLNLCLYPLTKLYYIKRNQYREKKWNLLTVEEKQVYLRTTKDVGNRRLDFRFAH